MRPTAGLETRPLGPARTGTIVTNALYDAILDGKPYPIRGLIGWGSNLLIGRGNVRRGREALAALEFFVHAELFLTSHGRAGRCRAAGRLRLRARGAADRLRGQRGRAVARPVSPAPRPAARREPVGHRDRRRNRSASGPGQPISGAATSRRGSVTSLRRRASTLEALRAAPGGIKVPLKTQYAKYAQRDASGVAAGFATPSRKVEIYSETLLAHGYAPLPEFIESGAALVAGPELAERYPLVLTCAKHAVFCDSQNRAQPSLRRRVPHPEVEVAPTDRRRNAASPPGTGSRSRRPEGSIRARARFNTQPRSAGRLRPDGWWQACPDLGLPGYDPFSETGSNFNLLVGPTSLDPVSGTPAHRSGRCEIRLAG